MTNLALYSQHVSPKHVHEHNHDCAASHMQEKIFLENPEIAKKQRKIDAEIREAMYGDGTNSAPRGVVYTVPVVVHVVHEVGTAIGVAENISDAQVLQGIADMNEAFRNLSFYNPATGADTEIEFCLAAQDPLGNFTTGINRIANTAHSNHNMDTEETDLKSTIAPQWDATKYCNIWLVKEICDNGGSCGTAGYAYTAAAHGFGVDGIVNEAGFFGSSQNNSKVHIHEMGHYLNLSHTFDGCVNNDCTTDGDQVCDTPPDNSTSAVSCAGTANSCNTDENDVSGNNPFRPIAMGGLGEQNDMFQNYLDYGFQSCQDRFTPDQATRMRTALTGARASLLTSSACINPSVPVVYFETASIDVTEESNVGTTGCSKYRDVTITMSIGAAPTGDANITINYAGTATGGAVDYTAGTAPEITFASGSAVSQSFTIRVWDDATIEGTETIDLTYTIGAGTDAVSGSFNQTLTINILDDDALPATAGKTMLLNEDFSGGFPAGWNHTFFACPCTGGDLVWNVGTAGLTGNSIYISEDGGTTRVDNLNDTRRLALNTPSIDASAIAQDMFLEFDLDIGGDATNDYLEIFYNINGGGWFLWQTPIHSFSGKYAITLPASFQGNSFELGFVWRSNGDGAMVGDVPSMDNVQIYIEGQPSQVETENCSVDVPFGPNDVVYVYNGVTNDIVATITNQSAWDYGCTTFAIDRVGTSAVMFQNALTASYATQKTLLVTPTNNNPAGNYKIRLYYSAAEIAGWEAATGESRANLGLFKSSNPISAASGVSVLGTGSSNGAYNTTDYYVESDFVTGFSGFAAAITSPSPLPIELTSFEGKLVNKSTILNWETQTEKSNDFFDLEHSTDGINFENVATIDGAGTSLEPQSYKYIDKNPAIGNNYYRLKQTDLDGEATYVGKTIVVTYLDEETILIEPNPIRQGQFNLIYPADSNEEHLDTKIYSIDGKLLQSNTFKLQNGVNQLTVSVADLNDGVYVLRVAKNGVVKNLRFVVIK
ncbi:MAG: T9SS type A sorting domain-containing protein [Aureispira sp.]|nr:T9SS type A sorting domain-containing protein [Aureispira sp.]